MARKKKHPEHVNHERWLVSYADFITLLFAFFTTLYAISTVDQKKAGKLQFSMMTAFHLDFFPGKAAGPGASSVLPSAFPAESILRKQGGGKGKGDGKSSAEHMRELADDLEALAKSLSMKGKIEIRREASQVVVSLAQAAFFSPGASDLDAQAVRLLKRLTRRLRAHNGHVRVVVEGHADATPFSGKGNATNWELSAARAISVTRLVLAEDAVQPSLLSFAGYGSHHPIAPNDTPEGRARNRRVDLVLRPNLEGDSGQESDDHDSSDPKVERNAGVEAHLPTMSATSSPKISVDDDSDLSFQITASPSADPNLPTTGKSVEPGAGLSVKPEMPFGKVVSYSGGEEHE